MWARWLPCRLAPPPPPPKQQVLGQNQKWLLDHYRLRGPCYIAYGKQVHHLRRRETQKGELSNKIVEKVV